MAITKLEDNLNIVQALADRPNALDGLSAAQLKAKFDAAPNIIKEYINNVLIPELQAVTTGSSGADKIGATTITNLDGSTVQAVLESLRNKLKSKITGSSGADFVSTAEISGLPGGTVQELLKALKDYIDSKTTEVNDNYVSKNDLTNKRKLSEIGNFTGSWFGVTNPAQSDPGIQGLVELHTAQLADVAISVKTFGAKGDGLTDDSVAFREANLYGYNKKRIPNVQLIPTNSMQIYIPNGIYRVKGNHIFGSPIPQGQASLNLPAIAFKVVGDNATIIWELDNVNDELFYFDGTITMPQVSGLTIIPVSENQTIPIGGTIFKYYQNLSLGYADASKGSYENISVWSGRASSNPNYGTKIKNVFHSIGNAMSDLTSVTKCRFNYFETLYKGENQESVNWTFDRCGFYAGGFANSIYFDFAAMGDNFNVKNSSFSVGSNETLLRTRSTIAGNKFTQAAHYNINFENNRIELYGNLGSSWKLCDMNFGRLNFKGTNFRLASGSGNVKTIVAMYGLANINFENIVFNEVLFLLPIATAEAINGALSASGAILKFCDLISGKYTFKYYDGISEYSIKDVLISSSLIYKSLLLENCTNANGNSYIDFELTNNQSGVGAVRRTERTINLSRSGVALGNTFALPPFQTIKNIKITGLGTVPSTFDKFRIYFGDKSLNNYLDVPNPKPTSEVKNEMMLWEGIATIFNDDINLQSITVYVLDNGIETGSVRSQIAVSYEPLDPLVFGITTITNTIQIKTKSKTIASGNTANRPTFGQYIGQQYYDTSIGKLIFWDGVAWVDKMSRFVSVPASASATGNIGDWSADTGFLYLCHAINTWKRVAIATW